MNKPLATTGRVAGRLICLFLLLGALAACSNLLPSSATPTTEVSTAETPAPTVDPNLPERGQARVDSVQVLLMESFPVQVSVVARGELPDSCTVIDEIITQQSGNAFRVAITTFRQSDQVCTQVVTPFEESIPLEVVGLPAGTYTVSVNGINGSFTLDVDNVLTDEATIAPTTESAAGPLSISGRLWHDLCAYTGSPAVEGDTPPEGCVVAPDGTGYQANGVREEAEPGILGAQVFLLPGDCTNAAPDGETAATTAEDGSFGFADLTPGVYCVFLDTTDEANAIILEEGTLTAPTIEGVATNSVTVNLEDGGSAVVEFGYDYRFRPLPEVGDENCTNSIEYIQDLNVPDDTIFPPNAAFTVSWRLRNNGTCPWTTDYALAFIGGDQMSAPESVPLTSPVAPGQTVDLSVDLIAPAEPGTYRGNWQISNAAGEPFGINGFSEDAFWVQIVVEEGAAEAATPLPGSAAIGGVVWEDVCTVSNGNPSRGCVETQEGSGFYRGDGSQNFGEVAISGLTVILGAGACPPDGIIAQANQLATAVTDADGLYRFAGLDAGLYCVAIEALSPANVDLLIPGNWTWPAPGVGRAGVRLAAGQERLDVDFGWDYQE